jgi:hypothetical protein
MGFTVRRMPAESDVLEARLTIARPLGLRPHLRREGREKQNWVPAPGSSLINSGGMASFAEDDAK